MSLEHDRRRGTQWLTLGLLATVFGGGVAWASLGAKVDSLDKGKLDALRFVQDSTRRDGHDNAVRDQLNQVLAELRETNQRLREMACAGRAGCR